MLRKIEPSTPYVAGVDSARPIDVIFVNAPLRDYGIRPRVNNFTLPVLGMAYIATYAAEQGFNVGVLDAEALGLPVSEVQKVINTLRPRWVGFNLLAPTYEMSALVSDGLDPSIHVMVGGHQAKAMPERVLKDARFKRLSAVVVGEGETRVAVLLGDLEQRARLPGVMWRDQTGAAHCGMGPREHLAPDVDKLPLVDRRYLADDPFRAEDGRIEANIVGSRGCVYNCSFCGAAWKANPDVTVRTRSPICITCEMQVLSESFGVTAFRFVDDLFLGYPTFIDACIRHFEELRIGEDFVWDATGRINVFSRMDDFEIRRLVKNGCREVALGIESGSPRMLEYIDKRITPEMTTDVVRRLLRSGISVKGYFILGFPTESTEDFDATVSHVRDLWKVGEPFTATFRASVFEFRPYPGTPEWFRLINTGQYTEDQLLNYSAVDLTDEGLDEAMRGRDEFNFSVDIQFGEVPVPTVRSALAELAREQYTRNKAA